MANHTHHTGRLTADPELRVTPGGTEVCNMRLAVQRRRGKDGEDRGAFFINVVAFNGLAGVCNTYLKKGSRVLVEGQLDIEEWTDREDVRRWTPKILAEQVEFLDPRPEENDAPEAESTPDSSESAKPRRRRASAKAAA